MLDFFRRHQRYFFVIITIVIVISFSFFGTYNTLSDSSFREQIAFRTVDGTDITRHELDEMVLFLSTDTQDKVLFGGAWGPNFLNDGVIKKDFLETGLASLLIAAYPQQIQKDLIARSEKEKRYNLYTNPNLKFVGVESAWKYFAPDMIGYYHTVRSAKDPMSQDAIQSRIALFLMERQLPAPLLRQVLRYQEKQYSWLTPDKNLDNIDLSLFGYNTVENWFGPNFIRLAAEFIINAATIAENKGYEVAKAEALADLYRNSEISYKQNTQNPRLGVANSKEYLNEQLRLLGLDQNNAGKMWRQVLLFRRLFQEMGNSIFVDPFSFQQLDDYALESASGDLYRLPKELRLNDFAALQKFETYLEAVSKRSDEEKAKLTLPKNFLSANEIAKKTPELVQKSYLVEVSHANKKSLEGNVGVKDTWNWETSDKGWEKLTKEFPELAKSKETPEEERFALLDTLDDKTRLSVDSFARSSIVNEHPHWLEKALEEAPSKKMAIRLQEKGPNPHFIGLTSANALMALLDDAPLTSKDQSSLTTKEKETADKLTNFSADKQNFYHIVVIERASKPEILTFAEADKEGILDKLLKTKLEAYYLKIRDENPKEFKDEKNWKTFADVEDKVADLYFASLLKSIKTSYKTSNSSNQSSDEMINDYAATLRFYPYMQSVKEQLQKDPSKASELVSQNTETADSEEFKQKIKNESLAGQWKLERSDLETTRSSADQFMDMAELLALPKDSWTNVNTPANGDINFFFLKEKGKVVAPKGHTPTIGRVRTLLSDEAQKGLMNHVLEQIKAKNAISLDYLNQTQQQEDS